MCLCDLCLIYCVELCALLFLCVECDCVECVCALVCDGVWCVCVCVFSCALFAWFVLLCLNVCVYVCLGCIAR